MTVNFGKLQAELLLAVRGKMSQSLLSKKLGFTFNQVYRWETGRTAVKFTEFMHMLTVRGFEPEGVLRESFGIEDSIAWKPLFQVIRGVGTASEIARKTGLKAHQIGRWLRGDAEPSLEEALTILFALYSKHLEFLGRMLPGKTIASLVPLLEARDRQLRIAYTYPFAGLMLNLLDLEVYRSVKEESSVWIARRLNLPRSEVASALEEMLAAGLLTRRGKKLVLAGAASINLGRDPKLSKLVQAFWLKRAAECALKNDEKATFAYFTMSLDHATHREIQRLAVKFYEDVANLAKEQDVPVKSGGKGKNKKDQVIVFNLALQLV